MFWIAGPTTCVITFFKTHFHVICNVLLNCILKWYGSPIAKAGKILKTANIETLRLAQKTRTKSSFIWTHKRKVSKISFDMTWLEKVKIRFLKICNLFLLLRPRIWQIIDFRTTHQIVDLHARRNVFCLINFLRKRTKIVWFNNEHLKIKVNRT